MDDIIVKTIELVILIIAMLIGRYLVPIIKTNVDFNKLKLVCNYADIFVNAAEQIFLGEGLGELKLDSVTALIKDKTKDLNIKLSDDDIRSIIENAVKKMNNESKK